MKTVIEMARNAGGDDWGLFQEFMPEIHRLVELVRADERAQRTWVELTDREIDELWMSHHDDFGNPLSATGYERAIEAKLKEKNNG